MATSDLHPTDYSSNVSSFGTKFNIPPDPTTSADLFFKEKIQFFAKKILYLIGIFFGLISYEEAGTAFKKNLDTSPFKKKLDASPLLEQAFVMQGSFWIEKGKIQTLNKEVKELLKTALLSEKNLSKTEKPISQAEKPISQEHLWNPLFDKIQKAFNAYIDTSVDFPEKAKPLWSEALSKLLDLIFTKNKNGISEHTINNLQKSFESRIFVSSTRGAPSEEVKALYRLTAKVAAAQNNFNKAMEYLESAFSSASQEQSTQLANKELIILWKELGQKEKAYAWKKTLEADTYSKQLQQKKMDNHISGKKAAFYEATSEKLYAQARHLWEKAAKKYPLKANDLNEYGTLLCADTIYFTYYPKRKEQSATSDFDYLPIGCVATL